MPLAADIIMREWEITCHNEAIGQVSKPSMRGFRESSMFRTINEVSAQGT